VDKKLTTSEIIILVSGAVALIFSFLDWFGEDPFAVNGWDGDVTFPLGSYIPIIGVIMAGHIALTKFANTNFPDRVLGFTWTQIHLALGLFATLLALGWLIIADNIQFGFWLTFLAAIGLFVGAIMLQNERGTAVTGPTTPPTPF
jgi:hypothetical protein